MQNQNEIITEIMLTIRGEGRLADQILKYFIKLV